MQKIDLFYVVYNFIIFYTEILRAKELKRLKMDLNEFKFVNIFSSSSTLALFESIEYFTSNNFKWKYFQGIESKRHVPWGFKFKLPN